MATHKTHSGPVTYEVLEQGKMDRVGYFIEQGGFVVDTCKCDRLKNVFMLRLEDAEKYATRHGWMVNQISYSRDSGNQRFREAEYRSVRRRGPE